MPSITCICCNKESDENKFVTCSICKNNYYYTCVDLNTNEVKSLKNKPLLKFTCKDCTKIGDEMTQLKSFIKSLQDDISQLKDALRNHVKPAEDVDLEEIIREVSDRETRKKNLIVYGVKENHRLPKSDQMKSDKSEVANILKFLNPDINVNIEPVRLGKFDATKPTSRPLRISFQDEQYVFNYIRNASKLKNGPYSTVKIAFDRTPRQLETYRKTKAELDARITRGEVGLKIKYVKGSPRIISSN